MNQNLFPAEIQQVMPIALDTGLFISLCTIQAPDLTLGASGAPSGTYADVAGLVNLPCMSAPPSLARLAAGEAKSAGDIESRGLRHVLLNGYYADLAPEQNWGAVGWRAIVDGITYDLLGAESDSQRTQTRLELALVSL